MQPKSYSAALVSVGGSPDPVLYILKEHRPKHIWYFCSDDSRKIAEEKIQPNLDWHPQTRFIEVDRFEELGPCYRELRRKIPEILNETQIKPEEVLVDYTGGTKTMSAALVLAAIELFDQFSYVGGTQREKGGLGVTINGQERIFYLSNPLSDLAIREIERARDLWNHCQFEAVSETLIKVADRVSQKLRFIAMAELAQAMAARHRLDFSIASKTLTSLRGKIPVLFDGKDDLGLIQWTSDVAVICDACKNSSSEIFLQELLDNALRTAAQGRFEDAAARLYRAMEMRGQIWLADATRQLFVNGRCKKENVSQIPSALADFCQPAPDGDVKLGLEKIYRALTALGHPQAVKMAEDFATGNQSRLRKATENRNSSILGHGVQPITEEKFTQMKEVCQEFLDFNLCSQMNPILLFNPQWLE